MSIFKRKRKEKTTWTVAQAEESSEPIEVEEVPKEEWVWVEGYKGTDVNMCCRDFQYELGKQYDMPDDAKVRVCESGFHLCLNLDDVFNYYNIGESHRFFKVKALVRLSDKKSYRSGTHWLYGDTYNKLVAKSIIFVSELTNDEILKDTGAAKLPDKYKDSAIKNGLDKAICEYQSDTLIQDGYSVAFAEAIVSKDLFDTAHAVGSQSDLSMDMKVLWILRSQGEIK